MLSTAESGPGPGDRRPLLSTRPASGDRHHYTDLFNTAREFILYLDVVVTASLALRAQRGEAAKLSSLSTGQHLNTAQLPYVPATAEIASAMQLAALGRKTTRSQVCAWPRSGSVAQSLWPEVQDLNQRPNRGQTRIQIIVFTRAPVIHTLSTVWTTATSNRNDQQAPLYLHNVGFRHRSGEFASLSRAAWVLLLTERVDEHQACKLHLRP